MSESESASTSPSVARLQHRWIPLVTVLVLAVALVAIVLLPERFDRGSRLIFGFLAIVAALGVVGVWYFVLAGAASRIRLVVAAVLGVVAVGLLASVRRVEFSGDMTPTFDFRWKTDRADLVEAHREQLKASLPEQRTAAAENLTPGPLDVLEYRGPRRDGVTPGPPLARDWSAQPPKLVWRQPVGGGYASFVVIGPLAITIEQRRDQETIVAYDVDSGAEYWKFEYTALFHETLGGDGPRTTPTIVGERVLSLGATGELVCLELATGKPRWQVNILAKNQSGNLDWGMSGSPLVVDGLAVVNPGNQKGTAESRALTSFAVSDGQAGWSGGAAKAGYASPLLVSLGGVRQVLNFGGQALAGYDAIDGRELWSYGWTSDFDINAAQPVVLDGDRVLITSESGAAVVKVSQAEGRWSAEPLWTNRRFKCGYSCPIALGGYVYGLDSGLMACVDLADGKLKWKSRAGQYGHGQLLLRDDLLVVLAEDGRLALVEASPERFVELGSIQAIEGKTWNNPTLVGGRVFVRNHLEMAAYDLPLEPAAASEETNRP